MKDETFRQIMRDAYRLLEKHETPSRNPRLLGVPC